MELNKYIDHTLLKPESTHEDIRRVCEEAKAYNTASVCVNPIFASFVAKELEGTDIKTCCVVGFPLGATPSAIKAAEAKLCVENGAQEIDMVISVGAAREGDWEYVEKDIKTVADAIRGKALLKVIIETCLLNDEQKVNACLCAKNAGADFVKTPVRQERRGRLREDFHRLLHRRRHRGGRGPHAGRGRRRAGREGLRRYPLQGGGRSHDRRRRQPHWRQLLQEDHRRLS